MRYLNHILRFLIILFIAIGCSSGPIEEEPNSPPEFTERTPTSTADQIPTSTPVEEEPESDPEPEEEEPEPETEEEPEPEPEPETETEEEPEPETELEEEPEPEEEEEEQEEEEIVNTLPINLDVLCFSYLDCPNHEACNIISSTCYHCTEGWQCNNQYDIRRTRPSFCCTQEAFDEERCDLIGTCKE
jgi:hypothetical protein